MGPLFLKFADDSDVGYDMSVDLGDDPDGWIDEILEYVMTEHPYLAQALAAPVFEDFDEDRRDAVGHIIARSGDTVLQLPIIIRDGKLFPVDVYIQDGKAYPLTEARIVRAFFTPEVADAVADPEASVLDRRTGYDGLYGRVDDLRDGLSWKTAMPRGAEAALSEMGQYLQKNPGVLRKLAREHPDVLRGVFAQHLEQEEEPGRIAAVQVRRTGPGRYKVAAWRTGKGIETSDVAGASVREFLKSAGLDLAVLDRADAGETVTVPAERAKAVFEDDIGEVGKLVDRTGAYTVYTRDYKPRSAYVIADVVSLDGQPQPHKMVLMDGGYALQEDVVGSEDSGDPEGVLRKITQVHSPYKEDGGYDPQREARDYAWEGASMFAKMVSVVLRHDRDPGEMLPEGATEKERESFYAPRRQAIEPVQVDRAVAVKQRKPGRTEGCVPTDARDGQESPGSVRAICGRTRSGQAVTLVFSRNVTRPVEVDRDSVPGEVRRVIQASCRAYIVPDREVLSVNGSRVALLDSPRALRDIAKLSAARHRGATFVQGYQGGFRFSGTGAEGLRKSAGEDLFNRSGAELALAAMGCSAKLAGRVLEKAARGRATVYGLEAPARPEAPAPNVDEKRAQALCEKVSQLRKEGKHLKWAAVVPGVLGGLVPEHVDGGNRPKPLDLYQLLEGTGAIYGNMSDDVAGNILSLGFLQRDNIPFFASRLPQIQETVSLLAQMLLAARLNPETPFLDKGLLREALNHAEDVAEGLDGIAD